jgi:hypothetical protein
MESFPSRFSGKTGQPSCKQCHRGRGDESRGDRAAVMALVVVAAAAGSESPLSLPPASTSVMF